MKPFLNRRDFLKQGTVLGLAGLAGAGRLPVAASSPVENGAVRHLRVYYQEGDFAAWPANHGIWSWGNEILVGFQVARHLDRPGHSWDADTSRHKFARSLDAGLTWSIEDAYEQGITSSATGHRLGARSVEPRPCPGGIDFTHPDFAFTFRRATNVRGPSCFYYSHDRGKSWTGPFAFPNLDTQGVATRTEYFVEGKHQLLAFLTTANSTGGLGWSACARTTDGGKTWKRVSWLCPEPEGQAIMPAALALSRNRFLTVIRMTGDRSKPGARKWLACYLSEDAGETWQHLGDPADELGWNSNPPALARLLDGRICLVYGVRGGANRPPASRLCGRFSADQGRTWGDEVVLRGGDGANRDMGYVRLARRTDGKMVAVYYYNHALSEGGDPYRYIAATLFDPDVIAPA